MLRTKQISYSVLLCGIVLWLGMFDVSYSQQDVAIKFWALGENDQAAFFSLIAKEFYQKTHIKVEVQPVPWGDFRTKYLTAMAAGIPPDVATTNLSGPAEYGQVAGVIDFQQVFPESVARLKSQIFEGTFKQAYFRGHLFGIPWEATSLALFYRKDIFRKLNLQPPETAEEMEKVIATLTSHDYYYGFIWSRNTSWGMGTFIWPYGATLLDSSGEHVTWQHPGFLKGYKNAIRIWNIYNMYFEKPIELFIIDDPKVCAPMFADYYWRYSEIITRAPHLEHEFGIVPYPYPADGQSKQVVMGGTNFVVFRLSQHQSEAMKWIEFLLSTEVQLKRFTYFINLGERSQLMLSVNKEFWNLPLPLPNDHKKSLQEIIARSFNEEYQVGANDANRLLEKSIYIIENQIKDYIAERAAHYQISSYDFKKKMAQGLIPEEKNTILAFIDQRVEEHFKTITPIGQQLLDKGRMLYKKYYSTILDQDIQTFENKLDILKISKIIVALLIAMVIFWILYHKTLRKYWISYLFIAPPLLLISVFILIPIIVSVYISFTKYNPILPLSMAHWVGLENLTDILRDSTLWETLYRSFYYAVLVIPIQLCIGIIFASLLDKNLFPEKLFKFLYFSPMVTSVIAISLIWLALYAGTQYGWINSFLIKFGLIKDPIIFLKNNRIFMNTVVILSIWQGLAFVILIILAGLQNIPRHLYEAAEIDGANGFQQFFHITIPGLKPQVIFLVIMNTIGSLQVFEQIYMLGGGSGEAESRFGPQDSGMTMVPWIYRKGFEDFKMGEASAIAYILFAIIMLLTIIYWKYFFRKENNA